MELVPSDPNRNLRAVCRRFMGALAPAASVHMEYLPDGNGGRTGLISHEGKQIGRYSFEPGTDVPRFEFLVEPFLHLNGNMEYSRHTVLARSALSNLTLWLAPDPVTLPEVGRAYRHYKGSYYRVTSLGRHSKTGEYQVGYLDLHLQTTHYRPVFDTPLASDDGWTKNLDTGERRFVPVSEREAEAWCRKQDAADVDAWSLTEALGG